MKLVHWMALNCVQLSNMSSYWIVLNWTMRPERKKKLAAIEHNLKLSIAFWKRTFLNFAAFLSVIFSTHSFCSMPFNTHRFISLRTLVLPWPSCIGSKSNAIFLLYARCCVRLFFFGNPPSTHSHPIALQKFSKSLGFLAFVWLSESDHNGSEHSTGFLNISKISTDGGGKPMMEMNQID